MNADHSRHGKWRAWRTFGLSRSTWSCLLRGRHWPGESIGFAGICAKCLPCPDCGSKTAGHYPECPQ